MADCNQLQAFADEINGFNEELYFSHMHNVESLPASRDHLK